MVLGTMASVASAQTYYVRAGATGARNGADWTDAFTTLPTTMVRGATYYIAAGTYSGSINFNTLESGSTYIYIKKATVAAHGTSTGWSDSYGTGVAAFSGTWTFNTGYWDIDGVTGGGPGASVADWPTSWTTGHGISLTSPSGSGTIDLRNTSGRRGFRFRHLKLVNLTPVSNTTTSYGRIFWLEAGGQTNASDVTIEYVYVPDFQGVPFHVWGAHDWLIQYTYFEGNGIGNDSNVHREVWSCVGNDRWTWRWNYVKNQVNSAVWACVNGGGVTDSVEIYGNIIDYTRTSAGIFIDSSDTGVEPVAPNNWKLFNNTVVGWQNGGPLVWLAAGTGTYFRNNIYANHDTDYAPAIDVVNKSHNGFYNLTRPGVGSVTSAWASASGSNAQIFSSDPFVDYAGRDLRLKAATQAGSSAGSPAGNAVDMFGHQRGADGVWDLGALEFGSTGGTTQPPSAPTNLRVIR